MAKDLTDIHAAILRRASKTKVKPTGVEPEKYVNRIADLEDPTQVLKIITSRAREFAAFRTPHDIIWREGYRAWHQILDPEKKEDKWRSKRFIPLLFQHIESTHPAIASAVFGGTKIWNVVGQGPDGRDNADVIGSLMEFFARGPSRMKREYIRMMWWAIVCGTGLLDHYWIKETGKRKVAVVEDDFNAHGQPVDETGQPFDPANPESQGKKARRVKVMKEKDVVLCDDPRVKSINPFDVWLDPSGEAGIDIDSLFMAHDTTLRKIIEASKSGGHLDPDAVAQWLEAAASSGGTIDFKDEDFDGVLDMNMYDSLLDETGYASKQSTDEQDDVSLHGDRKVRLLVYRTKAETFTIAPGGRIIGWSENPNAHGRTGMLIHNLYEIPDCPYGRGLSSLLLPHQELVNENINRAMDTAEITLMAPIGVDRSRVSVLDDKFRWAPNALIRTRGDPGTAVKRLDMPAPTDHAMAWDQHFKRDADDTTGMTEQARGITPAGINTATEFSGLQANIKVRTFLHVERTNDTLERSAILLIDLIQQYMTQKRMISMIGEDGLFYKEVDPTQIVGDFTVRGLVSSSRMAPAMKIQQLISVTQVLVPLLQQVGASPFMSRYVRMLLKELEIEDVDRLIPKSPEKIRDPFSENVALRKGIKIDPSPYERHDLHIEAHSVEAQKVEQLIAAGEADPAELDRLYEHIEATMRVAQEAAGSMMGTAPAAAPPGGSPERAEAGLEGTAAAGGNGVKGTSSPGPAAAPGRSA